MSCVQVHAFPNFVLSSLLLNKHTPRREAGRGRAGRGGVGTRLTVGEQMGNEAWRRGQEDPSDSSEESEESEEAEPLQTTLLAPPYLRPPHTSSLCSLGYGGVCTRDWFQASPLLAGPGRHPSQNVREPSSGAS